MIQLLRRALVAFASIIVLAIGGRQADGNDDGASKHGGIEKQIILARAEGAPGAYAIPKMLVTSRGTAIVVAQDRTGGDWAKPIDPIVVRSIDGGRTWSTPHVLAHDTERPRRFHLKPTGIVEDARTGRVFVFVSRSPLVNAAGEPLQERWFYSNIRETRRLGRAWFLTWSDDDGATWSRPVEITGQLIKVPHWQEWSPVHTGVQLRRGEHAGRLVVPCRIYCPDDDPSPHDLRFQTNGVIFSDDGGKTWTPGGRSRPYHGECSIVEIGAGAIYASHRQSAGRGKFRTWSISRDGGVSFAEHGGHEGLADQRCHAGIARVESTGAGGPMLILSNVPGPRREGLVLSVSRDEGRTWTRQGVVEEGRAAYSDLAVLPDGTILCVYETGMKASRRDLAIARLGREWLGLP